MLCPVLVQQMPLCSGLGLPLLHKILNPGQQAMGQLQTELEAWPLAVDWCTPAKDPELDISFEHDFTSMSTKGTVAAGQFKYMDITRGSSRQLQQGLRCEYSTAVVTNQVGEAPSAAVTGLLPGARSTQAFPHFKSVADPASLDKVEVSLLWDAPTRNHAAANYHSAELHPVAFGDSVALAPPDQTLQITAGRCRVSLVHTHTTAPQAVCLRKFEGKAVATIPHVQGLPGALQYADWQQWACTDLRVIGSLCY